MIIRIFSLGIVASSVVSATAKHHNFDGHSAKNSRKGESLRHRELKTKGTKGSKSTRPVCLSYGEVGEISGTTVEQTGPVVPGSVCDTLISPENWDSDDCVHYEEPFFINGSTGPTATFVFDDGTDYGFGATPQTKPPLGDGAVCGSVNNNDADKVILTYVGDIADLSDPTFDLQNEPAQRLESVKYSFWVQNCPTAGAASCPGEFYLNIYTRRNQASTNYYDCRFDFVPSQGGLEGTWTTFHLSNIKNIPATGSTFGIFSHPDCNGPTTIQKYIDAEAAAGNEVVLGTTYFEALKFNMGDTSPKDGLRGCYDALHIKLTDEEATRVYDFE